MKLFRKLKNKGEQKTKKPDIDGSIGEQKTKKPDIDGSIDDTQLGGLGNDLVEQYLSQKENEEIALNEDLTIILEGFDEDIERLKSNVLSEDESEIVLDPLADVDNDEVMTKLGVEILGELESDDLVPIDELHGVDWDDIDHEIDEIDTYSEKSGPEPLDSHRHLFSLQSDDPMHSIFPIALPQYGFSQIMQSRIKLAEEAVESDADIAECRCYRSESAYLAASETVAGLYVQDDNDSTSTEERMWRHQTERIYVSLTTLPNNLARAVAAEGNMKLQELAFNMFEDLRFWMDGDQNHEVEDRVNFIEQS